MTKATPQPRRTIAATAVILAAMTLPFGAVATASAATLDATAFESHSSAAAATAVPSPTEPVETEPVETEPVEAEPVATEPAPTEPVLTEPAASEPAATDPAAEAPAAEEVAPAAEPNATLTLQLDLRSSSLKPEDVPLTATGFGDGVNPGAVVEGIGTATADVHDDLFTLTTPEPDDFHDVGWFCTGVTDTPSQWFMHQYRVFVKPGDNATCTMVVTELASRSPATFTYDIEIINDDGGTATAADMTVTHNFIAASSAFDARTVTSGETVETFEGFVLAQVHGSEGYDRGTWSCVGARSYFDDNINYGFVPPQHTIVADSNADVRCVITLNDVPTEPSLPQAEITLNVAVTGSANPSDVALSIVGYDATEGYYTIDVLNGALVHLFVGDTPKYDLHAELAGHVPSWSCTGDVSEFTQSAVAQDGTVTPASLVVSDQDSINCTVTMTAVQPPAGNPPSRAELPKTGAESSWLITALSMLLMTAGSGALWLRARR